MFKSLMAALVASAVLAPAAQARDIFFPGLRSYDAIYTQHTMERRIAGHRVTFDDGTTADFHRNGKYILTKSGGGETKTGRYQIRAEGMICVVFDGGGARCDTVVRRSQTVVFVSGNGQGHYVESINNLSTLQG